MSSPSKIKSKQYRNWVRGALGLFYLQKGLYSFTDRVVKAEHTRIVQSLTPCTTCAVENILPAHASGQFCIQWNKGKCNCRTKTNRNCPTCSKIYDDIILLHRFREPQWMADCSTWYNDHWQFAKCFLTTTTKGSSNSAAETDASGLLSIIINGLFFQQEIQCNIDPPNDCFSQVREIRNEILHNSTLDLTDQKVTKYLQSMVTVLEDKKVLCSDPSAQEAVKRLKEIIKDELVITISEEANVIKNALDALKEAKEQAEESIRTLAEEKQETIKETEENIRKLAEDTQSSLWHQTSTHTTEIDNVKERAKKDVASTVSTVFEETYKPEIKALKQRLIAVEAEQKDLQRKQQELEQKVANLQNAEVNHERRSEYLEKKQVLQQYLVHEYQKHYVKTWICPLLTHQNDFNINDVYVSPRMVVEEKQDGNVKNRTKQGNVRKSDKKVVDIERYCELFHAHGKMNKTIFVVGDVGTGKSSFCKMMIQNWCSSIKNRKIAVMGEDDMVHREESNKYEMNQFDFLFYIPLREMPPDIYDTVDMIKTQLNDHKSLVDDIFANDSERILILTDGLDEWTPFSLKLNRQLLYGILASRSARDSTIITTSRPYSRGILNLKSSEYDLKVALLGLKNSSVHTMVNKSMQLLDKTEAIATFNKILYNSNSSFKDIEKAPMLLQHIICLYCNGYSIGQSVSFTILHMVNAVLGWEHERLGDIPTLQCSHLGKHPLPNTFGQYSRCQENRELLLLIGEIAYHAYIEKADGISSLVFGRSKLKQLGLSADDISTILQTGILTEINCADPTYEKSQLSFIHTSYVEFFAALYLCSCYLLTISDSSFLGSPLSILERLIVVSSETSVTEILRLENVFIMICGLVPDLTEHVCEYIYQLTLRQKVLNDDIFCEVENQIQRLTFNCLSEHNSVDQETVVKLRLRHLSINWDVDKKRLEILLSALDPAYIECCTVYHAMLSHQQIILLSSVLSQAMSLRTLKICGMNCKNGCEDHTIDLTDHRKLQCIELKHGRISVSGRNHISLQSCKILNCSFSHENCSVLLSLLSQAISLQTLQIYDMMCEKDGCDGHIIDLTNHTAFQGIDISDSIISVYGLNQACLQTCEISDCVWSHEQCALLSSLLSQAVSLQTLKIYSMFCEKDRCDGHFIDLTNHKDFQNIELYMSTISVFGINHTRLQSYKISMYDFSHEQCSVLTSLLSHAVSLRTLKIEDIKCNDDECEDHTIDLTNHAKLQSIDLEKSKISVSGINQKCLKFCQISRCEFSHEQCSSLSTFLSQAVSLQTLKIERISCIKGDCNGHVTDLTFYEQLQDITLSESKISASVINNLCLETCKISGYDLSHEQCLLISSSLSQSVALRTLEIEKIKCTKTECEGHAIDLTKHRKLHSLTLSNSKISVCGINRICPQVCKISYCKWSHEHCTQLSLFLSQAVSLNTLDMESVECTMGECEGHVIDLSKHTQLQSIKVLNSTLSVCGLNDPCLKTCKISCCKWSHKQCSLLSSFLSHAVSLRTLNIEWTKCTENECVGHTIDLSYHTELHSLELTDSKILVSGMNHTCLTSCFISLCVFSHEQWLLLLSCLSQTVSLQTLEITSIECTKNECEGHMIDLTNHSELRTLRLSSEKAYISGLSPTLESCFISHYHLDLSHERCASLCALLSHTKSLHDLELHGIRCIDDACKGHNIDITDHQHLNSLSISNCKTIYITSKQFACLVSCKVENCHLSHEHCALLCSSLSQVQSLNDLYLYEINCIKDVCEGHYIDLTNIKQLNRLFVSNCKTIYFTSGNFICLRWCRINNNHCHLSHKICSSLCTFLSNVKSTCDLELHGIECNDDACDGHDIDLSKQLYQLSISNCNKISFTCKTFTCLVSCKVSNCQLSHERCVSLCSFLSNLESVYTLELHGIE